MPYNLLTLPAEIRALIWNESLDLAKEVVVDNRGSGTGQPQRSHYLPWLNLQLTNYQVYEEGWEALVRKGPFMTIAFRGNDPVILPQLRPQAFLALSLNNALLAVGPFNGLDDGDVEDDFDWYAQAVENLFGINIEITWIEDVKVPVRGGVRWEYWGLFEIV